MANASVMYATTCQYRIALWDLFMRVNVKITSNNRGNFQKKKFKYYAPVYCILPCVTALQMQWSSFFTQVVWKHPTKKPFPPTQTVSQCLGAAIIKFHKLGSCKQQQLLLSWFQRLKVQNRGIFRAALSPKSGVFQVTCGVPQLTTT